MSAPQAAPSADEFDPRSVVVRFRDGIRLPSATDSREDVERLRAGPWGRFKASYPNMLLRPVFTDLECDEWAKAVALGRAADPMYRGADFGAFHRVQGPPGTDFPAVAAACVRWQEVAEAYVDDGGREPAVREKDDPLAHDQQHLEPAPRGIDARFAWTQKGGDGAGQRFIDLERGWTLDHVDIAKHGARLLHGTLREGSRAHGTAVLGEVCAVDNAVGGVGIVPNVASVDVVSYFGDDNTIARAILAALGHLSAGDVLLIEAQVKLDGTDLFGPAEAYDAEFEAIRLATARGIIVVEAGGNGTRGGLEPALDMDAYRTISGKGVLRRDEDDANCRDSGAIVVTAATFTLPHTRLPFSPHGARIDCYAWGENVATDSSDAEGAKSAAITHFGGTSAATAIIAGAAISVQGRAEAHRHVRLTPQQMRSILRDPSLGTLPAPTETTKIGVMPDLRRIFDSPLLR